MIDLVDDELAEVVGGARERSGIRGRNDRDQALHQLSSSTVCFFDVTNLVALDRSLDSLGLSIDAIICCLASRTGGIPKSERGGEPKGWSRGGEGSSTFCFSDITNIDALDRSLNSLGLPIDAIICCLASFTDNISESERGGKPKGQSREGREVDTRGGRAEVDGAGIDLFQRGVKRKHKG